MFLTFPKCLRSHRKYLSVANHASQTRFGLNHIPKAHYFLTPLCLSEDLVRIVGKGLVERKEAENIAMLEKKKLLAVATVQDHGVDHDVYKLIEAETISKSATETDRRNVKTKTMSFKADIGKNDLQRKGKQVAGFIEKGYLVMVRVNRHGYNATTSPKKAFEGMLSFINVEVKVQMKADQANVYSCELTRNEVD